MCPVWQRPSVLRTDGWRSALGSRSSMSLIRGRLRSRARLADVTVIGVIAAFPILYGFFAILLGQDADYDLLNYHYFDPYWAFVNHMADIAPAHTQTFLNPLLDTPFYFAANHLPGRLVGFLLGAAAGVSFVPLYLIGRDLLNSRWPALALAALGMFTAGAWSEAGTIFGDSLTAPLFLFSVWLVLRTIRVDAVSSGQRRALILVALAGLLAGVGAGLKLSGAPWAIATAAACLLVTGGPRKRLGYALAASGGVVGGLILSDGWWVWSMWSQFGNPLMPFFNQFFKSVWAAPVSFSDPRYGAHGLIQVLDFPFKWTLTPTRVGEVTFRELSLPIVEVLLLAVTVKGVVATVRRRAWTPFLLRVESRYVMAWVVIGYLAWAVAFGVYRYLIPVEMLSFILIVVLLRELFGKPAPRMLFAAVTSVILAVAIATEVPANWGRVGYAHRYFSVPVPPALSRQPSAVLMLGDGAIGFAIPSFPRDTFFAWVQGFAPPTPFVHAIIAKRLASYPAIYAVSTGSVATGEQQSVLADYGLHVDAASCNTINATVGDSVQPLYLCSLLRGPG